MMKLVVFGFAVLLGVAVAYPGDGLLDVVSHTLGGVTNTVGETLNALLGFSKKVTGVPWQDIFSYFDIVHGIQRVGPDACTCPYVYRGIYKTYPWLSEHKDLIGNVLNIGKSVTGKLPGLGSLGF